MDSSEWKIETKQVKTQECGFIVGMEVYMLSRVKELKIDRN